MISNEKKKIRNANVKESAKKSKGNETILFKRCARL